MSSLVLDVADAIVTEANDEFAGEFIAERKYVAEYDLPNLVGLTPKVTVVPKDEKTSLLSRDRSQKDIQIDVAVQEKITSENNIDLDPTSMLVDQIQNFFMFRSLDAIAAVCVEGKYAPIFSPKHIREQRTFTSVLSLTFRQIGGLAMSDVIGRVVVLTNSYVALSATQLVAIVEITASPNNAGTAYMQGDDGSDVPWLPGEYHVMRRIDLNKIKFKGTPGDIITIVGGTT